MVRIYSHLAVVAKILVSDFKTNCLRILADLEKNGGEVIVTKRGKPLARILPVSSNQGRLKGDSVERCQIIGDIVTDDNSADWEALAS